MPALTGLLLVLAVVGVRTDELSQSYTGFANLEKLYTLEDELITISDVILKQELSLHNGEDVHNISSLSSTIENVKDIHLQVLNNRNMTSYIVHPINIYHMIKRLVREWNPVVQTLDESKSCEKVMRTKVTNIASNLPEERHLESVCASLVRLQVLHNLSANDLMSGDVMGEAALAPLSLDEAFEIGHVAYKINEYEAAADWLTVVAGNYSEETTTFAKKSLLNLLSSSNYMLDRPEEALDALEAVLKIDPSNVSANRNKRFIEEKMAGSAEHGRMGVSRPKKKKVDRLVEQLCIGNVTTNVRKSSRLFCTYFGDREDRMFSKPTVAGEVLSLKPLVILFHNVTTYRQQRAVKHLGYEKMKQFLFKNRYSHPDGIYSLVVQDKTHWQWVPNLERQLSNIRLSDFQPDRTQFMVQNVGMGGARSNKIMQHRNYRLGTFLVFLSTPKYGGGQVVFPFANLRVEPEEGAVLFYETKAHNQTHICPVPADTIWVGTYPLVDKMRKNVCQTDSLLRPKP